MVNDAKLALADRRGNCVAAFASICDGGFAGSGAGSRKVRPPAHTRGACGEDSWDFALLQGLRSIAGWRPQHPARLLPRFVLERICRASARELFAVRDGGAGQGQAGGCRWRSTDLVEGLLKATDGVLHPSRCGTAFPRVVKETLAEGPRECQHLCGATASRFVAFRRTRLCCCSAHRAARHSGW